MRLSNFLKNEILSSDTIYINTPRIEFFLVVSIYERIDSCEYICLYVSIAIGSFVNIEVRMSKLFKLVFSRSKKSKLSRNTGSRKRREDKEWYELPKHRHTHPLPGTSAKVEKPHHQRPASDSACANHSYVNTGCVFRESDNDEVLSDRLRAYDNPTYMLMPQNQACNKRHGEESNIFVDITEEDNVGEDNIERAVTYMNEALHEIENASAEDYDFDCVTCKSVGKEEVSTRFCVICRQFLCTECGSKHLANDETSSHVIFESVLEDEEFSDTEEGVLDAAYQLVVKIKPKEHIADKDECTHL